MLKQDFSTKSLLRITGRSEIIKFSLGRNPDDYKEKLTEVSETISSEPFTFSKITKKIISKKIIYCTDDANEHYALKKISNDLKRLYRLTFSNRDEISEQVLKLLETASAYSIIRIDIKSFYESVSFGEVLSKISNDKLLSAKSISLIQQLHQSTCKGLPRGLSISPILSEIFMRDFDRKIRGIQNVYYYARYVDDIIIISFEKSQKIYDALCSVVSEFNLSINEKLYKSDICIVNNESSEIRYSFDYLGYKYIIKNQEYKSKRVVDVELSDDKKRKIKTRIIHSLLDRVYGKETPAIKCKRLIDRLNMLSSNYPISSPQKIEGRGTLRAGIFYSNRLVNKSGVFNEFNSFLSRAMNTQKDNFFGRTMKQITATEKTAIRNSICFVRGFKEKTFLDLSPDDMKILKSCWKHKNHKRRRR
jgi:hypothetical protein